MAVEAPDAELGRAWWSQRFLQLLESFGLGSRLARGREYARSGQVLELDVEPGIALARVQGSRFTPYRVRIRPQTFSEHQWRRAEKAIGARALTLARLLAGEMPADIEEVLAGAKLALLPARYDELRVSCTCPDEANPCKHTAAAYYMLAERFDADPFALFTLRGRTPQELIAALRDRRARTLGKAPAGTAAPAGAAAPAGTAAPASTAAAGAATPVVDAVHTPGPAGSESVDRFWRAGPELAQFQVSPLAAEFPDSLLRPLGPLALGESGPDLGELLAPVYRELSAAAERRALAD